MYMVQYIYYELNKKKSVYFQRSGKWHSVYGDKEMQELKDKTKNTIRFVSPITSI